MVGTGTQAFPVVDKRSSAEREDLPHSGGQAEHGKPVSLPMGRRAARQVDGGAGRGRGRKRMPFCNGMDRSWAFGDITPREGGQTSLWSFLTRESGKPAKEEKQMITENSVGAASDTKVNRPTIDWRQVHHNVRRLQM